MLGEKINIGKGA